MCFREDLPIGIDDWFDYGCDVAARRFSLDRLRTFQGSESDNLLQLLVQQQLFLHQKLLEFGVFRVSTHDELRNNREMMTSLVCRED